MNPSFYRYPKQKSSGGLRRLFPLDPVRPPALTRSLRPFGSCIRRARVVRFGTPAA
jgi:hypothetical protein